MNTIISNQHAKVIAMQSINRFHDHCGTSHDIRQYIIKDDVSDFISLVVCLHLIIMFKDEQMLSNYLDEIYAEHRSVLLIKFMINYSIIDSQYVDNSTNAQDQCIIHSNSINALTCAALWNTNPNIIRILMLHGADINSINESGQFPDEISESIPYYNHLRYYIHTNETTCVAYGKRSFNEFIDVSNQLRRVAGEGP